MERRKLIYNVMQDIWKISSKDVYNKSKAEMTSEDWDIISDDIAQILKRYQELPEFQQEFVFQQLTNLTDLIIREDKKLCEVTPSESTNKKILVWLTKEEAKKMYGIDL